MTSSIVWPLLGVIACQRLPYSAHEACRAESLPSWMLQARAPANLTAHRSTALQGTAATEAAEFYDVYGLSVTEVPTNKPSRRRHMGRRLFLDQRAKYLQLLDEVRRINQESLNSGPTQAQLQKS